MSTSPTISAPDPKGDFVLLAASQAALHSQYVSLGGSWDCPLVYDIRSGYIPAAPRFKFAIAYQNVCTKFLRSHFNPAYGASPGL